MKKPLYAALRALARWRDDGDVALALLHAKALSANDPGWSHCSEVFLRGAARAISACADEIAIAGEDPEAIGDVARHLALASQVLAGIAAGLRRKAQGGGSGGAEEPTEDAPAAGEAAAEGDPKNASVSG